jgi:primosomal protein N' (replication factor Y)
MSRFARVVVESDLIQLDREFDFIIPDALVNIAAVGQRVRFQLGRAKRAATGFIVDLPAESSFASTFLTEIVSEDSVLTTDVLAMAKQVAARQAVSLGEILKLAIPDHMPRVETSTITPEHPPQIAFPDLPGITEIENRSAVLTSTRSITHAGLRFPDWCWLLAKQAYEQLLVGKSSIVILPEQDQIGQLLQLLRSVGLAEHVIAFNPGTKKSDRFNAFHEALTRDAVIAIGARSVCYAPVKNLGLIALFDDADDSLREQGSPFTHARELAMIRAADQCRVLFAANYRSIEIERLVDISYLKSYEVKLPPPRISFSAPAERLDQASFKLIRESLEVGPVLILLPRKGNSATVYCGGCDARLKCANCGGPIWEPQDGQFRCRVCSGSSYSCLECGSSQFRRGRTGSHRTASEFGKSFPSVAITEATGDHKPSRIRDSKQLVIATPGSAPRVPSGYSAVVIVDPDVWLATPSLKAEQKAIRDWMEAIELLSDNGRAHISGISQELGSAIALGQHRQLANAALRDLGQLQLPPVSRTVSIESDAATISTLLDELVGLGAVSLRSSLGNTATALLRFSYSQGPAIAAALRSAALRTNSRLVGNSRRRGLRIVMDDPAAL